MFSKNNSKSLFLNLKNIQKFNKSKFLSNERIQNPFNSKNYKNENVSKYSIKPKYFKSDQKFQFSFDKTYKKSYSTNSNLESNDNDNSIKENNKLDSTSNNNKEFYLDNYFQPALNEILSDLNNELQNPEIDKFMKNNNKFENLYKLFMDILKKGEDNLFPYLTLIFEITKKKSSTNLSNKISFILIENYLNLKRKYICLSIMNQIISNKKASNNLDSEDNSDFNSSYKNKIFGGGLFEKIISQVESANPKIFKGYLVITKNYKDSIDYYQIFRRFDKEGKLKIKKFGSVSLGIKGISLKNEKNLIQEFIKTEQEDKKNQTIPEYIHIFIKETIYLILILTNQL